MAERTLILRVIADDRALQQAMARDAKAVDTFGKASVLNLGKVDAAFTKTQKLAAGGFAGGIVATEVVSLVKETTGAASDLNEQVSKNRQVFGASADAIEKWSKTTADGIGLSQRAALEATGTFGNLFTAIGTAPAQAADLSRRLVTLASDLASFNNANPADVLDAIRSGLVGEAEPLRRYGVLLSEARVQQEAMAETGKTNAKELTNQEKAAARVAIIFRDTQKAQGDFLRTSSGLANQQRILAAETENLKASIGTILLPVVNDLTKDLADATGAAAHLTDALQKLGSVKIPTIVIPFTTKRIGGGGTLGDILELGLKGAIRAPLGGVGLALNARDIFNEVKKQIDGPITAQVQGKIDGNPFVFHLPPVKLTPPEKFDLLPGVDLGTVIGKSITGPILQVLAEAKAQAQKALDEGRKKLAAENAAKAKQKREDFFTSLIGGLELNVDRAQLNKRLDNDLKALLALKKGVERQIAAGVDVANAQAKLVQVIGDIAAKRKEIRDANRESLQAAQFRALGLSGTGEELAPGIENLQKRLTSVLGKIGSGELKVGTHLRDQLKRARALIRREGKNLTEETRRQIDSFLDAASGKDSKTTTGPLTKTSALNANRILAGLGLSRDDEKELRARLSRFNSAGRALAGKPQPTFGRTGTTATPVVESHVTVVLDGDVVSRAVTRSQQKTKRRNPTQKRGPNRNR